MATPLAAASACFWVLRHTVSCFCSINTFGIEFPGLQVQVLLLVLQIDGMIRVFGVYPGLTN
jgi:hypothetical protein